MNWGTLRLAVGVIGALIFAAGGGYLGGMNAGWFEGGETNPVLPVLGVGAALVMAAFARSGFNRRVGEVGLSGRTAQVLLVLGPALYVLSWLIEFAIFGTFTLAFGLTFSSCFRPSAASRGTPRRHQPFSWLE